MNAQYYVKSKEGPIYQVTNPEYWKECKLLKKAEGKRLYKAQAIESLRTLLKPGDTVYTVLRHVSASGMSRDIDLYVFRDNKPQYLTNYAATALDWPMSKNKGIKVGGCGMDMGFHLVYSLSSVLFREGFAPSDIGIRPADGKSVNVNIGRGKNAGPMTKPEIDALVAKGWKFTGGRNGDQSGWDSSGGYALKQEWL
jgi:hypothetical protein